MPPGLFLIFLPTSSLSSLSRGSTDLFDETELSHLQTLFFSCLFFCETTYLKNSYVLICFVSFGNRSAPGGDQE